LKFEGVIAFRMCVQASLQFLDLISPIVAFFYIHPKKDGLKNSLEDGTG